MYCNAIYQLWSQIALVLQASIKCVLETISFPEVVTQCNSQLASTEVDTIHLPLIISPFCVIIICSM